jgi:hypothetical protein
MGNRDIARADHHRPKAPKRTMTQKSLADIAVKMRGIDMAMPSTKTAGGEIATRPT